MTSIIVSQTQNGKTSCIQDLAISNMQENRSTFIVLRNITADLLQFTKRWNDKYSINLNKYDTITKNPAIYICLSNVQQLSNMFCVINRISHYFTIVLDEADLIYIDKNDCKQTTLLYDEMYKNQFLHHKYYITATPFSLFNHLPILKCKNILHIENKKNYVGFLNINKWYILGKSIHRLTNLAKFESCILKFQELFEYIIQKQNHQIILFNCTSLILAQEIIGERFRRNYNINVIIDHGEHTIVYSQKLNFKDISFHCEETELGYKYLFKKVSLKYILQIFKQNFRETKIVILSGIKAGRGQSYKTEDLNEWHLTDLVYLPPKVQSCETLIQACGRITGIYNTVGTKLNIWTSRNAKDSIIDYINYQSDIINYCKNNPDETIKTAINNYSYTGKIKI
jgi:hypothetical protein